MGIPQQIDLFADFNELPDEARSTEFYRHDANWTNRMILGDNLQVMASLAEREGLRGKVQCIYIDPPYGIKFHSNFQWSTTSTHPKTGAAQLVDFAIWTGSRLVDKPAVINTSPLIFLAAANR